MRIVHLVAAVLGLAALLAFPAHARNFDSAAACSVGQRVLTSDQHKGRITRVDRDWSYCYVLQDDTGKEVGYLYSLLQPEGGSGKPQAGSQAQDDGKLAVGKYTCWVGSEAGGEMRITGPSTYESDGKSGKYRLESAGAIVFESGPFSEFHGKLLSGRRIGINMSGGTFYNMSCEPAAGS
jgi:hypothetical protein